MCVYSSCDTKATCYVLYVCVCGRLPKVKRCKDTAWVCVCLFCLGWGGLELVGWWYVGHSHHAPLAPLDRAGSTGEGGEDGGGREGSGVQNSQRKWRKRNEKSEWDVFDIPVGSGAGGAVGVRGFGGWRGWKGAVLHECMMTLPCWLTVFLAREKTKHANLILLTDYHNDTGKKSKHSWWTWPKIFAWKLIMFKNTGDYWHKSDSFVWRGYWQTLSCLLLVQELRWVNVTRLKFTDPLFTPSEENPTCADTSHPNSSSRPNGPVFSTLFVKADILRISACVNRCYFPILFIFFLSIHSQDIQRHACWHILTHLHTHTHCRDMK